MIENWSSGPDNQGLGLIQLSSAVPIAPGETAFQYDRACKSIFEGGPRVTDPGELPKFNGWFPDGRRVLYEDIKGENLRIWDTQSGVRSDLFTNARLASLSPDGKKISLHVFGRLMLDAQGRLAGGSDSFSNTYEQRGSNFLCIADAQSRKNLSVAPAERLSTGSWSPDGRYVLFQEPNRDKNLIVPSERTGGLSHSLTLPAAKYSWSPAGQWLAAYIEPPLPNSATSPPAAGGQIAAGAQAGPASRPRPEATIAPTENPPNLYILHMP